MNLEDRRKAYSEGYVRGVFGRSPLIEVSIVGTSADGEKSAIVRNRLEGYECTQEFLDGLHAARTHITPRLPLDTAPNGVTTLGEVAFDAYNEARGGVTFDGKPIPGWNVIREDIREAWEAAAGAIDGIVAHASMGIFDAFMLARTQGIPVVLPDGDATATDTDLVIDQKQAGAPGVLDLLEEGYREQKSVTLPSVDGAIPVVVSTAALLSRGWAISEVDAGAEEV